MTNINVIRAAIMTNNAAVEKAVIMMSQGAIVVSPWDKSYANYYASWCLAGKRLSGNHLSKARVLALKYCEDIAGISKPIKKSSASATLTIRRTGEFTIKTFGSNHCGLLPILKIQYEAKIECSAKVDDRGFLFDQLEVDRFFQGVKSSFLSCEMLTMHLAEMLALRIMAENPSLEVKGLDLTLSPQPFKAGVTFAWKA